MENLTIKYFPNLDRIRTLKEAMLKGEIPMYESPIEAIQHYSETIQRQEENEIIAQIQEKIGIVFDRDELIKALNYDRNQYQKGYEDAKKQYASRWIPVSEELPKCNGVYEVTMRCEEGVYRSACYFDGQDTWHNDNRINFDRPFANDKVIAWKPETEPYKESD